MLLLDAKGIANIHPSNQFIGIERSLEQPQLKIIVLTPNVIRMCSMYNYFVRGDQITAPIFVTIMVKKIKFAWNVSITTSGFNSIIVTTAVKSTHDKIKLPTPSPTAMTNYCYKHYIQGCLKMLRVAGLSIPTYANADIPKITHCHDQSLLCSTCISR